MGNPWGLCLHRLPKAGPLARSVLDRGGLISRFEESDPGRFGRRNRLQAARRDGPAVAVKPNGARDFAQCREGSVPDLPDTFLKTEIVAESQK